MCTEQLYNFKKEIIQQISIPADFLSLEAMDYCIEHSLLFLIEKVIFFADCIVVTIL
jgi:hypothetical protein